MCLGNAWWISRVRTPCGHCFHRSCLRAALRVSGRCPYCTTPTFDTNIGFCLSGVEHQIQRFASLPAAHITTRRSASSLAVQPRGLLVWCPAGRAMSSFWIQYDAIKLATAEGKTRLDVVHQRPGEIGLTITTFAIRSYGADTKTAQNLDSLCKSIRAYNEDKVH